MSLLLFATLAGSLTVQLTGAPDGSTCFVALAASEAEYKSDDKPKYGAKAEAADGKCSVVFAELPDGTWSARAFADSDGSQSITTNAVGMPKEPYGFSNDARGTFGPPKFKATAFQVTGDTTISIKLK